MAFLRDSFNYDSSMVDVYNLGKSLISPTPTPTAAYVAVESALALNAASGVKKFTVNIAHNGLDSAIYLKGAYWEAYKTGLLSALAEEHIFDNEVSPAVNVSNRNLTSIDLNFSF
jgi:hypothetical protein